MTTGKSGTTRLDSWKEIALYLRRGLRTAQRWEREAGLPVRRVAGKRGAVYAFAAEIDAWWQRRTTDGSKRTPLSSVDVPLVPDKALGGRVGTRVQPFLPQDLRVDPDSAPGHAALGIYFFTLTVMGLLPPADGLAAARGAALRALHLDPSSAEAHAVTAVVAGLHDHRWDEADHRFKLALAGDVVPATVRFHHAAWFLSPLQRHDDAIAQARAALTHEPLYLLGRVQIGTELCSLGRAEDGRQELEQVLRIDPDFGPALGHLGRELVLCGRIDEAAALATRTHARIPQHPNAAGFHAGMLRRLGRHDAAAEVLDMLARDCPWSVPRARAEAHVVCGDFDGALMEIANAIDEDDPGIWILFAGTAGVRLRERPQWHELRSRLGLLI
jgi:Tfp pilus assembly protein PilF